MNSKSARERFIDRTARKPSGKAGIRGYNDPKGHYKSFRDIMKALKLKQDDVFCEIGSGGGVLLKWALQTVIRAESIDHSPDMVELGAKNNRSAIEDGRLKIIQGDAAALPWKDNSFTAAASANMFFFVEQPQAMLNELYRVLKPGGRVAISTMGKGILGIISFGWLYRLKTYSDKEMKAMLEQAGFSEVTVRTGFFPQQICYGEKKA